MTESWQILNPADLPGVEMANDAVNSGPPAPLGQPLHGGRSMTTAFSPFIFIISITTYLRNLVLDTNTLTHTRLHQVR